MENLSQRSDFETYKSLLNIVVRLTCLENNIVTLLIDRGLLDCMANILADESYCEFYEKVASILSNIACDSPQNQQRLLASVAYDEIINYGQFGSLQFRWNLISMINNLICNL